MAREFKGEAGTHAVLGAEERLCYGDGVEANAAGLH